MKAIKRARKIIEQDPNSDYAQTLAAFIVALETEADLSLKKLYSASMTEFELMLELMRDWRLDRYYEGKAKALSTALHADQLK